MAQQNNTTYASDVYMIEDDKSGYRRSTSPVLINKPTKPVKPPTTPSVGISCAGATGLLRISPDLWYQGGIEDPSTEELILGEATKWSIEVNGEILISGIGTDDRVEDTPEFEYLEDALQTLNPIGVSGDYFGSTDGSHLLIYKLRELDPDIRVRLIPSNNWLKDPTYLKLTSDGDPESEPLTVYDNPTVSVDPETGIISFCLSDSYLPPPPPPPPILA